MLIAVDLEHPNKACKEAQILIFDTKDRVAEWITLSEVYELYTKDYQIDNFTLIQNEREFSNQLALSCFLRSEQVYKLGNVLIFGKDLWYKNKFLTSKSWCDLVGETWEGIHGITGIVKNNNEMYIFTNYVMFRVTPTKLVDTYYKKPVQALNRSLHFNCALKFNNKNQIYKFSYDSINIETDETLSVKAKNIYSGEEIQITETDMALTSYTFYNLTRNEKINPQDIDGLQNRQIFKILMPSYLKEVEKVINKILSEQIKCITNKQHYTRTYNCMERFLTYRLNKELLNVHNQLAYKLGVCAFEINVHYDRHDAIYHMSLTAIGYERLMSWSNVAWLNVKIQDSFDTDDIIKYKVDRSYEKIGSTLRR